MSLTLSFHGAAECVTGSCSRLKGEGFDILVDCGMFQGSKTLKALNYDPFPFDVTKIDAVLLTHAHIDHSGLLPKLMKAGFTGPIYATAPARELCRVMLADSGDIQESEVEYLNRRNEQRGKPLVHPIYTARDAAAVIKQFQKVKFDEAAEIMPGLTARFWAAGHMLGAASIEVTAKSGEETVRLLFSGDIGSGEHEYLPLPTGPQGVDHLIMESTYGDRVRHKVSPDERRRLLAKEVTDAHAAGGPLLIPTFAVGRAQELIMDLMAVMESGQAPKGQIFLDSPLAIEATEVFLDRGWNRDLGENPFEIMRHAENLWMLKKPQESDRLETLRDWHIILAGSGMCDAGRIRKHMKRLLGRPQTTLMISGYQAVGTLGRLILEGRQNVSIQGVPVRIRARIRSLDVYSGHADAEGLVRWAQDRRPVGGNIFLNHGEPEGQTALAERLKGAGFEAGRIVIPAIDAAFELSQGAAAPRHDGARLPPGQAARLDWHNEQAELRAHLAEVLESAQNDEARLRLLSRLEDVVRRAERAHP